MITPGDAWAILTREVDPLEAVRLPLARAAGAYLAEVLSADRDMPPADRSAMDGYAVRAADLVPIPARLAVDGEVAAGAADATQIARGHCLRIYTGANLPDGADTVIPVELTSTESFPSGTDDGRVDIMKPVAKGAHIFRRGETARVGQPLLPTGTRLGPRQIGVAAAVGCAEVLVHRTPRIQVITTGKELLSAEDAAGIHQVRDSNGPMLEAALAEAGMPGRSQTNVPDDPEATLAAIKTALLTADALILTGGLSAGRHDYVPQSIADAGADVLYRGIAMKPGKPQLYAKTWNGKHIFALPGNPLSAIVGLHELVLPGLRRLAGCALDHCLPLMHLPLALPLTNEQDRLLVVPARLEHTPQGTRARPCPPVGSADLVTGGQVDGAVLLPPCVGTVFEGSLVRFRPWDTTGL